MRARSAKTVSAQLQGLCDRCTG